MTRWALSNTASGIVTAASPNNFSSIKEEMKTIFAEELAKFKEEIYKKMDEITSTNKILQQHVTSFKRSDEDLIKKCAENEQYGRWLCLRIKGIPREKKRNLMKYWNR